MDNREKNSPVQAGSSRYYTIGEFLAQMEPQYREDQNTIRQCIAGLTDYAAQLAAKRQEKQIPQLRRLCIEMAEFWGLAEDDTLKGFQKMKAQYGGAFDSAVSATRDSGHVPEMSEQTRQSILDGLELYAQEMRHNDPEMEKWAVECENLADSLQHEWLVSTVEKCITGLTIHAANLAANQQENSVPGLDSFIPGMMMFFGLGNADETAAAFEQAVTKARDSGQAPVLTEQHQQDILAGLELYAQEMRHNDPEMEEWAADCEALADSLRRQWQAESTEDMKMGGLT